MTPRRVAALIAKWREQADWFLKIEADYLEARLLQKCADELEAAYADPDPEDATRGPVAVAGSFDRSLADFERSCLVHLDEEQARPNPDNALIALLCDAVRLTREYGESFKVDPEDAARPADSLTVADLHMIASVLTDHADQRAEDEDQPDGQHDAAVCRAIARKAGIAAANALEADARPAAESELDTLRHERDEAREQFDRHVEWAANSCACQHDGRGTLTSECQEHQEIREECDLLEQRLAARPAASAVPLTFDDLRATNLARLASAWPAEDPWEPWDWTNATAGEVGEACIEGLALLAALSAKAGSAANITKKMNRVWPAGQFATAWNKPEDQRIEELSGRLGGELADVVIYADLLASKLGMSLGDCVRAKFNAKSDEIGSPIKLPLPPGVAGADAVPPQKVEHDDEEIPSTRIEDRKATPR